MNGMLDCDDVDDVAWVISLRRGKKQNQKYTNNLRIMYKYKYKQKYKYKDDDGEDGGRVILLRRGADYLVPSLPPPHVAFLFQKTKDKIQIQI